jgi:hypothetical protein
MDLSETGVTDAGVIHLAKLPALMSLTLHSTAVSSKGLRALGELPSLRWLEIHSESVGDEDIAELRRAFLGNLGQPVDHTVNCGSCDSKHETGDSGARPAWLCSCERISSLRTGSIQRCAR